MSEKSILVTRCVLSAMLVASIAACQGGEQKGVTLTESDSGKTITIKRNEYLQVVLVRDSQPGLDWDPVAYDQKLLKQRPVIENTNGNPQQRSDKVFLEFEPLPKGTTVLRIVYHQQAHPEIPPVKTFEVTVTIE